MQGWALPTTPAYGWNWPETQFREDGGTHAKGRQKTS